MNFHKECLKQIGKVKLDPLRIALEYATRHPKEFLQFVAPELIKPKVVKVHVCTDIGASYPFSADLTIGQDVFDKCKLSALNGIKNNRMLYAIKDIRGLTHCGLMEGKCFYDMVKRGEL